MKLIAPHLFGHLKRFEFFYYQYQILTYPLLILSFVYFLMGKYLFSKGYRFRLHVRELPGKPDIVLPKYNTAIQVRGCFWHGHGCRLSSFPKTNRKFWKDKILNNKKRDAKNDRKLRKMGYRLLVVNECNIEKIRKWNL